MKKDPNRDQNFLDRDSRNSKHTILAEDFARELTDMAWSVERDLYASIAGRSPRNERLLVWPWPPRRFSQDSLPLGWCESEDGLLLAPDSVRQHVFVRRLLNSEILVSATLIDLPDGRYLRVNNPKLLDRSIVKSLGFLGFKRPGDAWFVRRAELSEQLQLSSADLLADVSTDQRFEALKSGASSICLVMSVVEHTCVQEDGFSV